MNRRLADAKLFLDAKVMKQVTPAATLILPLISFTALVLGLWRLGVDMAFAQEFPIASGIFSHWQVWMSMAVLLEIFAMRLRDRESHR
jgi:hypothetical protein